MLWMQNNGVNETRRLTYMLHHTIAKFFGEHNSFRVCKPSGISSNEKREIEETERDEKELRRAQLDSCFSSSIPWAYNCTYAHTRTFAGENNENGWCENTE